MDLQHQFKEYIQWVNNKLEVYLTNNGTKNKQLFDAMSYSIFAGGKRLRPVLALGAYHMFKDDTQEVMPYACGLEMIHTYSLIHDDLPAMDDDDFRRNKPTNHKVFGEGVAILAGDGLLNYAFEIMLADALINKNVKYYNAIYEISRAAGVHGMIGGQLVDLESEGKTIDIETLDYIHFNKTASMIIASLKVGTIIGDGNQNDINNMEIIGKNLGLAFQIRDDILDIIGNQEMLGKDIGSDQQNEKSTYPSIYGLEYSKNKVMELTQEVDDILSKYGEKALFLRELSLFLMEREY
ncbi:polyprenyl synthetase family protein [Alkaliphilus peptidifermentans]|uniref:Farnesyl diphosphate synthase n=1 Tax=Alkaliphilus peptidifermentans DSM 18978 TaxID=1120976 RepID=A0A1G5KDM8_9FIRM|nr:farnesyl diphosphate synthase [Alkaliphilus peptidifermentans]SCY98733.1 farnesyl-diphosphate synthase [Alkaliphilus peptidifermentans DSM 18978]